MTAALSGSRDAPVKGIALGALSVLIFSIINLMVKWLAETYPVAQIAFFRCLFAMLPVAAIVAHRGWRSLRTRRLAGHLWRTSFGMGSIYCAYASFHLLPLADATAIGFASPLFVTALSVPLLGERVGPHRWAAVLIGFAGVLIMLRPTGAVFELGAFVALANAFFFAMAMICLRDLGRTELSVTVTFYYTLFGSAFSALPLPFLWVPPTAADWLALAGVGLLGGLAQLAMTRAYGLAPAAVVSPLNYTGIVWATSFGFAFWGEMPSPAILIGALLVIASGLYLLHRETRRMPDGKTG